MDEVTAFAAGHRPCGGCQRKRYEQFVEIWCKANLKDSKQLDEVLHAERTESLVGGTGQAWTLTQSLKDFAKRSPAEIVRADDTAVLKIGAYQAIWDVSTMIACSN